MTTVTAQGRPPTPSPRRRRRPLQSRWAYLLIGPAMVVFAVFNIGPTVFAFGISLFDWNYLNAARSKFVGLKNYVQLTDLERDPSFLQTMGVSFYFVGAMVIGGTVLSLALAMLMRRATKVMLAARASVFLAHVTPVVATSLVWIWIYNPRFGLANAVLHLFGLESIDWLGNRSTAMLSVILYTLWHEVGFTMIVFVGGLATISSELSEAARVDGASPFREFWYVTLPQLTGYVVFVVVIGSIASLHAFTQFFMLTGGGPDFTTATLGYQLYQQAFVFRKTGYGAALAVVLFAICVVLSLTQLRLSRHLNRTD